MDIFLNVFEKSEDKNPPDFDGRTPLHIAAFDGLLDMFKIIFENVEDKNPKQDKTCRHVAHSQFSHVVNKQLTFDMSTNNFYFGKM